MAQYRLYCLDAEGMSVAAEWIEAGTDGEAIDQARLLQGLRQCEVWLGNRLVATLTDFDSFNKPAARRAAR